ncbi:MAG: cysteine desulfurase/selenocysteine lyase [Kiritimatiellia bacterium]|jgi:cysteine desulfurase/selenocysteine lyase
MPLLAGNNMTFDANYFKAQFPLFDQPENHGLVYLDNAATTQKPQCVIDAISHFYVSQNGNAQRASHRLARAATAMLEQTRQQAADFLGAASLDNVVFTSGATEALNMIAYGLSGFCTAGDEILLSHAEHHANLLPWQRLAEQRQCSLIFFPEEQGLPCWQQWLSVLSERTRIIAFTGASNVLGSVLDVGIIASIKLRFPQVIVVVDASQMACHIPLQAEQWQCDFLACSAHKFYGPTGIGLLYGRTAHLQEMLPLMVGGEMVSKVDLNSSSFVEGVQRFEAGTSSLSAIAGLGACLQFWQAQDRPTMQIYERQLTVYLHQQLNVVCNKASGLQLLSLAENNVGIAVVVATASSNHGVALSDLGHWLDEHDIAVRVGDHCAQPLWQALAPVYGSDKGLRISLAAYNTREDIDQLVGAINSFLPITEGLQVRDQNTKQENFSSLQWRDLMAVKSWQQRFKILVGWGKHITEKPAIRQDQYLVRGCESTVWLKHHAQGERHYFLMDSDSNVIKGLSALLLVWFNGKTSKEIARINIPDRYQQLGLQKHLSPSRMNGFMALLSAINAYTASKR